MKSKKLNLIGILAIIFVLFFSIGIPLFVLSNDKNRNPNKQPQGPENMKLVQDFHVQNPTLDYSMNWSDTPSNLRTHILYEYKLTTGGSSYERVKEITSSKRIVNLRISKVDGANMMQYELKIGNIYRVCATDPANPREYCTSGWRLLPFKVNFVSLKSTRTNNLQYIFNLIYGKSAIEIHPESYMRVQKADDDGNGNPNNSTWEDSGIPLKYLTNNTDSGYKTIDFPLLNATEENNLVGKHVRIELAIRYRTLPSGMFVSHAPIYSGVTRIGHHVPVRNVSLEFNYTSGKIKSKLVDMRIIADSDDKIKKVTFELHNSDTIDGTFEKVSEIESTQSPNFEVTFNDHNFLGNKYYKVIANIEYTIYSTDTLNMTISSHTKFSYFNNSIIESVNLQKRTDISNNAFQLVINFKENINIFKIEYQKQWSNDGTTNWQNEGSAETGSTNEGQKYTKVFNNLEKSDAYYKVNVKVFLDAEKYLPFTFGSIYIPQIN